MSPSVPAAAFASHTPPAAIAIGAVVGLIIGGLFGYVFLILGKAMRDLRWFLGVATVFMLFISAGLMALTASAFKTVALTGEFLTPGDAIFRSWSWSRSCLGFRV